MPRPTTHAYLDDDGNDRKKAKGIKKCVIKQKLKFKIYKVCLTKGHNKDLKAIIMMLIQKMLIR